MSYALGHHGGRGPARLGPERQRRHHGAWSITGCTPGQDHITLPYTAPEDDDIIAAVLHGAR